MEGIFFKKRAQGPTDPRRSHDSRSRGEKASGPVSGSGGRQQEATRGSWRAPPEVIRCLRAEPSWLTHEPGFRSHLSERASAPGHLSRREGRREQHEDGARRRKEGKGLPEAATAEISDGPPTAMGGGLLRQEAQACFGRPGPHRSLLEGECGRQASRD